MYKQLLYMCIFYIYVFTTMMNSKIFDQSSFLSGATTRHNICMTYVSLAEKRQKEILFH